LGFVAPRHFAYRDSLAKLIVDVRDTPQNRLWMKSFKERWKIRLKQIDLWLVSYNVIIE